MLRELFKARVHVADVRHGPGDALAASHPAHGKGAVNGRAAAYVCVGTTCSLPIEDARALARQLSPTS